MSNPLETSGSRCSALTLLATSAALLTMVWSGAPARAQLPTDLPWSGSTVGGRQVILQPGVAAFSCGTTLSVMDPSERFTFGLANLDGAVPASGRLDVTANVDTYHHPSWTVDRVGNIFGVAINERTGAIFLAASSNYGAGFFGHTSVLRYGDLGGGAQSVAAAGTVYEVDAVRGDVSVFSVLPQQTATVSHVDCEGSDTALRTTGVGLGNIVYDALHDQYFVTNVEDGRIYRLGPTGAIRDSYDPGIYDDGLPGISNLLDLAYGLAVEPGGGRLFYGGLSRTGQVPLFSLDLTLGGGFVGAVDDSSLPSGATWSNFVGQETLHTLLDVEVVPVGGVQAVSDLDFTPAGELLAGVRVGCDSSWFTSYNHGGESNLIAADSSGLFNVVIAELDVSWDSNGAEDAYGGVAHFERADGAIEIVTSSSDILAEIGPHGLAIFAESAAGLAPIEPLGAVSYGAVDTGDPKGVGGSVDVFSAPASNVLAIPTLASPALVIFALVLAWAAMTVVRRKHHENLRPPA